MANFAKKFTSQKLFWLFGKSKDDTGMDIGQVLDQFTKKQGVACDGAINGLFFTSTTGNEPAGGPYRLTLEMVETEGPDAPAIVIRNCAGELVYLALLTQMVP